MEAIYTRRPDSHLERLLMCLVRKSRTPARPAVRVDLVLTDDVDIS